MTAELAAPLPRSRTHTLHPGDVVCAERGDTLETLLGSCIAVILTDPRRTLGVMCHIVHSAPAMSAARDSAAHAGTALLAMYRLLLARGIVPHLCEAYVFGGGNMFPAHYQRWPIGATNSRTVLEALAQARVQVLAHDVGGNSYRRLRWTVGTQEPEVTAVAV